MKGYSAEVNIGTVYVMVENAGAVVNAVRDQIVHDSNFVNHVKDITALSINEERAGFGAKLYGEWCHPGDMDETMLNRWFDLINARASAHLLTLEDKRRFRELEAELSRRRTQKGTPA